MANTYGDSGNRWWVGWNTAQGVNANLYSPSGYESLPSGNAADDAQFAAAAKANKNTTSPNTISVENVSWYNIQGPFSTQAQANAAIPAIAAKNPAPGVLQQLGGPFADVADAAHALAGIGAFLTDAWGMLSDGKMWRSLGWLLLGILLMLTGIGLWIGPAAARRSPLGVAADLARRAYG